jgi:hypothetical protein
VAAAPAAAEVLRRAEPDEEAAPRQAEPDGAAELRPGVRGGEEVPRQVAAVAARDAAGAPRRAVPAAARDVAVVAGRQRVAQGAPAARPSAPVLAALPLSRCREGRLARSPAEGFAQKREG